MNRARKSLLPALSVLFAVILLGIGSPGRASTDAHFTKEQLRLAEEYGTVYIAGSTEDLPLEGLQDGTFMGVMPEIYRKLSEMTGLRFSYLDSGADRYALAENQQCDILSLVAEDEASLYALGLLPGPVCFRHAGVEYRIAYTQRMPAELCAMLNSAIGQLSGAELSECALSGAAALYAAGAPGWARTALWILAGLCAALLALLLVSTIRGRRDMKKALCTDPATELLNWNGFSVRFERLKAQRCYPLYSLAYIQVDYGRELIFCAEDVLKARMEDLVNALRAHMQSDWFAARADAFHFILCFAPGSQTEAAESLAPILDAMEEAANRSRNALRAGIHAGVCRADATQGSLDKALSEMRIAAWSAKEQGMRVLTCSEQITRSATLDYRTAQDILSTADMEAFYVYILPRVELPDARVAGGQALVRWKHPARGMLSPRDFLPYIEKTDKIKELDLRVFSQVCAWNEQRRKRGLAPMLVTCNLSEASLNDPGVCGELAEMIARHGVRPGEVGVEVESGLLKSGAVRTRGNIERLHAAGVTVILDNFGSDATSLGALTEYAVDMVKIHSRLLPGGNESEDILRPRLRLLNNTIGLCKKLGFRIICAGVENTARHTIVRKLGCDFAEGYHYFRPMPCDEFDRSFADTHAVPPALGI